jgi:tripartite-type tricarboxylate transporter receptor subunit TctC
VAGVTSFPASAQNGGARPVKIIVPVPPGGTSDLVARIVADLLKDAVGQPVVVENKPGATGRIAAEALKKSAPDGTTLLIAPIALPVFGPLLFKDFRFHAQQDFVPVAQIATFSYALAVRADHPARDLSELLAWMKANPTQATFGTAGAGSVPHLIGVTLSQVSGVPLRHVPHRGVDQVKAELMSGDLPVGISALSDFVELHRSGLLRIIATSGEKRSTQLPEVATFHEQGFAVAQVTGWTGLLATAGTPRLVLEALSAALVNSMKIPEAREKFTAIGVEPTATTPEAFAAIIAADIAHWAPVVKTTGFAAD